MRAIPTLVLLTLIGAGAAAYWKRDEVIPVVTREVPALAPYLGPYTSGVKPRPEAAAAPGEGGTRGGAGGRGGGRGGGPGVPVILTQVVRRTVPLQLDAVGTVQPIASIAIKPRLDSQIATVHVAEGALVKQGDPLFTLDARTLQAQMAQVEAQILKDRAQVEQARRDLARMEELLAKRIGTEVQRDTAATALKVQLAQLAADEASRANLAASLTYTEIRAPVTGRIGSISAKAGSIVRSADAAPLTTINQVDPIYVAFSVSQSSFPDLRAALARGEVRVEVRVGEDTLSGAITFIENAVDPATGTIGAKATLPNAREQLWPGAFVPVQVHLGETQNAIAVPAAAVQIGQQGPYVFTVREGRAHLKPVQVARNQGALAVIASGLEPGEDVVVDGQLRLVNGAAVSVQQPVAAQGPGTAQGAGQASAPAPAPRT